MSKPLITSVQNPRVKEAIRLRDRRQRKKEGRFLIDGAREMNRAIDAGVELVELFVCESQCASVESRRVLEQLADPDQRARLGDPHLWIVSPAVLEKLAFGQRSEGVLGVGRGRPRQLDELSLSPIPLVAVLDGVEKPGNIGAVLRSADAAHIDALVLAGGRTDLFNPNTIRASLGTVFTVPVAAAGPAETLSWLRSRRLKIHAARPDATTDYTSADLRGPAAIVLGSEAAGLSSVWSAGDIVPIRLPMRGVADSLNVSATAAVLFYEALRQRSQREDT